MAYLYMLRPDGLDCRKIGVATNLKDRRHTLQSMCPFRLHVERALLLESREVALAYEGWICSNAQSANMHGEWFKAGSHLHDLFDCVAPAVDVTEQFAAPARTLPKKRAPSLERLEFDVLFARASGILGGNYRAGVFLTGNRDFRKALRDQGIPSEWVAKLQALVSRHA
jgi:hypothetical protein